VEPDANKELVRRFWAAMWTDDPAAALRPEGVAEYVAAVTRAFPDYHAAVVEAIAEGDLVAARMHFTGTHEGEALGRPPTGRKVAYAGTAWARVRDGVIDEMWVVGDTVGLLEQIEGV
jgi:predicted ester cyclase